MRLTEDEYEVLMGALRLYAKFYRDTATDRFPAHLDAVLGDAWREQARELERTALALRERFQLERAGGGI